MVHKEELQALSRSLEQHPDAFQDEVEDSSNQSNRDPSSDVTTKSRDALSTTTIDELDERAERVSERESQKVFRLRMVVLGVLIFTSLAVSAFVFKITVQGEVDDLDTQYQGAATKVIDAFSGIMNQMGSVAGLGVSYTSQGARQWANNGGLINSSWPFVTLDDFPPKARNALQLSGALYLGMCPVLRGDLFDPWDDYVENPANQLWIAESLAYQYAQGWEIQVESQESDSRVVYPMHYLENGTVFPEVPGHEWYLPMWQTSPYVMENFVNNNLLRNGNTTNVLMRVYDTKSAVLSDMMIASPGSMSSPDPDTVVLATLESARAGTPTEYEGDPVTDLFIPIYDGFGESKRQVVGVLNALIHWKSYFRKVLPESIQGIVVVLEYSCGSESISDPLQEAPVERRTKEEVNPQTIPEEGRDLITFSIIDVSDFEHVTPSPSTDSTTSYWNINTGSSPSPANSYWNPEALTTPAPTTAYWNANAQSMPTTPPQNEVESNAMNHSPPPSLNSEKHSPPPSPLPSGDDSDSATPSNASLPEDAPTSQSGTFFTYIIEGEDAQVLGAGDLHDPLYDDFMRMGNFTTLTLQDGTASGIPIDQRCNYRVYVYPSQAFYDQYVTSTPISITVVIVAVFIFAIITFLCYNRLVERRLRRISQKAKQSTAIVSSLFPKNVRRRLMAGGNLENLGARLDLGTKSRLKGFMAGETTENDSEEVPIADLFPHCTVFFADIAGFTAWASTREPSQVFILLQTVYQAFDQLAKRRRVFKVETIGDCYMAVTGLPDPQDSHASIMIRFAHDCIVKMREVTKQLESELGPDTTELTMRVGLNSGPVTAGVLRGERARFQLFGDTVNTASRMESTGIRGKIQVSESTAEILKEQGRDHWLTPRADAVRAKGKGVLKTYWANPKAGRSSSSSNGSVTTGGSSEAEEGGEIVEDAGKVLQQAQLRLVDWIVKLMTDDIKKMVFVRQKVSKNASKKAPLYIPPEGGTCMDEVKHVIHMPKYDGTLGSGEQYKKIQIDSDIIRDLTEYVTGIARMYRLNPFHNFEHACHVTMSVNKLIRRIVTPELEKVGGQDRSKEFEAKLHDYTYGITSDPLAMFAMTFSALIHDVDHRGVSNMQLGLEAPDMAEKYHQKSIAEQNSLDLAWMLLMQDGFDNLRRYLFGSNEELLRFRQLIVNIVLATDIFDKELNDLRKNRWKSAFAGEEFQESEHQSDIRATIVIEHIIQASDVSHTMQHWHVYQKWNKCLFKEMYNAYKAGRLAKDPASFWYQGEIGFFDNYIIPLAKKLKDCGVFGVSSDEYLNYALKNRAEWEDRGKEIVAMMVAEITAGEAPP